MATYEIALDPQTIPVALLTYDRAGRLAAANDAAVALLGDEIAIGDDVRDSSWVITDAAGWPASDERHPVLAVLSSGEDRREVVARVARDGAGDKWLRLDATPVRDAAGEVDGVLVAVTDLTSVLNDIRLPKPTYGSAAVAAVTTAIAQAALDPKLVLDSALQALSELRAGIWVASLLNKDPRTMSLRAANAANPDIACYIESMQFRFDAGSVSFTASVLDTGEPLLLPSLPFDEFMAQMSDSLRAFVDSNPPPLGPYRAIGVLVVPMRSRGSIVGTLGLFEPRSSNPLTPRDVRWVQDVADRIGHAADNAQLYVDAVSRLDRLSALRSVQLAIAESPDLRLTLGVILDQAVQGLAVDAADVLLVDDSDGQLAMAASKGFRSTSIPDYRMPVDEGMPATAISGRRIETVTGLGAFSQFRRRSLFAREGFTTYGAVPLMAAGRLVGVLEVFHRAALQPDREWFEFLDALGTDAAIAIERFQQEPPGTPGAAASPSPALTPLQNQILGLVAEGLPNGGIAERVHLSPHTVKFHVGQMLERAGVHNRTELARKATRERWI